MIKVYDEGNLIHQFEANAALFDLYIRKFKGYRVVCYYWSKSQNQWVEA